MKLALIIAICSERGDMLSRDNVYRGEFTRKERCSLLCFLSCDGIVEAFSTAGTFDREKIISNCRKLVLEGGVVQQYPGRCSVWILDGASIHCDKYITYFLPGDLHNIFTGLLPVF
jgi:hypothetical protein